MVRNIREAEKSLINKGTKFQVSEKDIIKSYRGRWEPNDYSA